jgi:hypothetical protein
MAEIQVTKDLLQRVEKFLMVAREWNKSLHTVEENLDFSSHAIIVLDDVRDVLYDVKVSSEPL